MVVEGLLNNLQLQPQNVQLGYADITNSALPNDKKNALSSGLEQLGFELLDDKHNILVNQIKNFIITQIHYAENEQRTINWSQLLAQQFHRDYSYLSKLFSETEGITIEQYIIRQKIERVKELLLNNEASLSQIAWQMGYSSTAHLSSQFKKITGLTPSQYKQAALPQRRSLDEI